MWGSLIAAARIRDAGRVVMAKPTGWTTRLCGEGVPYMPAMALPIGIAIGFPSAFRTSDVYFGHGLLVS